MAQLMAFVPAPGVPCPATVTGFVNKPEHGLGRGATDRQFFSINHRPCELPKVLVSVLPRNASWWTAGL